jgi:Nucleoside-diphosphate-sugar epimerases
MRYLITGTAGFVGFHLARRLLGEGHQVVGFDGLTPYYSVELKERRHAILSRMPGFTPVVGLLEDALAVERAADLAEPDAVIHLAAQAGVRYSLDHPDTYVQSNLVGTFNVLETVKRRNVGHFLLASTSSIYGTTDRMPFDETDKADEPLSFYAATKKASELMAHSYSHLWRIPTTAFRFFTVYGPWGRPDMALFKFVDAIQNGRPIDVYGHGRMLRDFTFVDDLVEAVVRLLPIVPGEDNRVDPARAADTLSPHAPFRIVNIGAGRPVGLIDFVETVEAAVGKKAIQRLLPMQKGDVRETYASSALLEALTGYRPHTSIAEGVRAFVDWYLDYEAAVHAA